MNQKHEFAINYQNLSLEILNKKEFKIKDKDLLSRLNSILRIQEKEEVVFFDSYISVKCLTNIITKKEAIFFILNKENIKKRDNLIILLPVLKKDSFEQLIYSCIEFGAASIIPISYEKSVKFKIDQKDLDRYHRIMISACEQSKNFFLPKIEKVKNIFDIKFEDELKFYADFQGSKINFIFNEILKSNKKCVLTWGPEGGFTPPEINHLDSINFKKILLTDTVLKSVSAGELLIGIVSIALSQRN